MKPNEAILKYVEAICKPNEASKSNNFLNNLNLK